MRALLRFLASCTGLPRVVTTFYAQSLVGDTRQEQDPMADARDLLTASIRKGFYALPLQLHRYLPESTIPKACPLPRETIQEIAAYLAAAECNAYWDELDQDEAIQALAKWEQEVERRAIRYDGFLDMTGARGVMIFQGYLLDEAILRHLAIRRGLPILSLERTLRSDRLLWESISGITVNRNQGALHYWRHQSQIAQPEADAAVDNYLKQIKSLKQEEHASPSNTLDWKLPTKAKKRVLFLGQIYTDSSLLYGLEGFANPTAVIASLIHWARTNEAAILLKLHPKESNGCNPVTHTAFNNITTRVLQQRYPELFESDAVDITIDSSNEYDTYGLIAQSDVVVTVNSQAGLEAAIMGKPVVHGNRCFYGNLGFTYSFSDSEDFPLRLNQAIKQGAPAPEQARKFFHCFYDYYCKPKTKENILQLAKQLLKR